jgi:hypothetical protein
VCVCVCGAVWWGEATILLNTGGEEGVWASG